MQTPTRSLLLLLPLLLALSACGGEEATVIDPELGLGGPATLTVVPGSSLSHDFSLQRNETANGPVSLSIEGLPEGVTATFDPATVAGDALNTTLRIEAQRNASRGVSLVTVRAVGGEDLIAERNFALEVRGLTVEGRLLSSIGNAPPEPTRVAVEGQQVITDGTGRFTFHDVALPYNLVIVGDEIIEFYDGATHPSPTIRGTTMYPRIEADGAIMGTVTPLPEEGEVIVICATAGEGAFAYECTSASEDEGRFILPVYFATPGAVTDVRVVARRSMNPVDAPQHFTGYAEQTVSIASGTSVEVALALQSSASTLVELTLVPPPAAESSFVINAWHAYGETVASTLFDGDAPAVAVPEGGLAVALAVSLTETHQYVALQLVSGPEDASITFPSATPNFASPEAGAILDSQTVFAVSGTEGGLNTHLFEFEDGGAMMVHTSRATFTLPDVSQFAPGFIPENLGWWQLIHQPEVTDIDAALQAPTGYAAVSSLAMMSGAAPLLQQSTTFVSPLQPRTFNGEVGPLSFPRSFGYLEQ